MNTQRLIIIGIGIILVIILVAWVASLFNDDVDPAQVSGVQDVQLIDQANTDLITRITKSGKITAKEEYESIRISISNNDRVLEIIRGYDGVVTDRFAFDNTVSAFESFLRAIDLEGFTESKEGRSNDERGTCPKGSRTVYEMIEGSQKLQRLWSGSCSKKIGTFDGSISDIYNLFKAQIPDYSDLTKDVRI